jgi:hypothetical protein
LRRTIAASVYGYWKLVLSVGAVMMGLGLLGAALPGHLDWCA